MLAGWGRFVYRFRWPVLVLSTLFFLGTLVVAGQGGDLKSGALIETAESGRARKLIQAELPKAGTSSFDLVFSSPTLTVDDPAFRSAVDAALAGLRTDPRVSSITTPYDSAQPQAFASRDRHDALAVVSLVDDTDTASKYYPELKAKVARPSGAVTARFTGLLAITDDFNVILENDLHKAEYVSFPVAAILLVLVFGTVVAALLPLSVGALGVIGGVAGLYTVTRFTDVSQYALNIVTLIGLGVAIDYSLFIVNRYREELRLGRGVQESVAKALATSGRAILFSGVTVAIGLSGMLFYQGTFIASMGYAGAIVVAMAVLYSLTFLPALLSILGGNIHRLAILRRRRRRGGRGFWHGLASTVMRRPILVLVPVLALIVLAGSPFARIRLANGDVTILPVSAESRQAYQTLVDKFPGTDQNQYSIVVRFTDGAAPLSPGHVPDLYDLSRKVAALPGIIRVQSVVDVDPSLTKPQYAALYANPGALPAPLQEAVRQTVGEHIVVLTAYADHPSPSDEARDLLKEIRALPAPAGGEMLVTGFTAIDVDDISYILGQTPLAIGWVMLATYVVLFLLLGSVLLPLKAVLMNLLSISASFGALVWVFQEGHLSAQLGFVATSIDPTLPVIMFCVVFGLSMDYEVLLMSRMQEEWLRTGDNRHAVAEGLARSGRLITGAAAIMVAVFSAFALASVVIIKAIGFGTALAVAIDATLVRALVVPATMRLLGDLNWWAPRPLARLYRRLGLGEAEPPRESMGAAAD